MPKNWSWERLAIGAMALAMIWMFYKISNVEKQSELLHYVLRNRLIDEAIKACNKEAEREEHSDRFDRTSIDTAHFTFAGLPEPKRDGEMSLRTPRSPRRSFLSLNAITIFSVALKFFRQTHIFQTNPNSDFLKCGAPRGMAWHGMARAVRKRAARTFRACVTPRIQGAGSAPRPERRLIIIRCIELLDRDRSSRRLSQPDDRRW